MIYFKSFVEINSFQLSGALETTQRPVCKPCLYVPFCYGSLLDPVGHTKDSGWSGQEVYLLEQVTDGQVADNYQKIRNK